MGKYIVKEAKTGFVFNLVASNGQVIAKSQVYSSKAAAKNGTASVAKAAAAANIEDQTVEGYEEQKNPKFEIYKDKAGEFRFRLKVSNGEIVAASEGYTQKASCVNGIVSVKKNSDSPVEEA